MLHVEWNVLVSCSLTAVYWCVCREKNWEHGWRYSWPPRLTSVKRWRLICSELIFDCRRSTDRQQPLLRRSATFTVHVLYTVSHKKRATFISDNNSGVSWSIFILFVLVETGRNTQQFLYLMAWWRHNCITSHVTKVCFIQLLLRQVKYVEFEYRPKKICQKPVGMWKFFLTEDW